MAASLRTLLMEKDCGRPIHPCTLQRFFIATRMQKSVTGGNAVYAIDDDYRQGELLPFQLQSELGLHGFKNGGSGQGVGGRAGGEWGGRPVQLEIEGAGEAGLVDHRRVHVA